LIENSLLVVRDGLEANHISVEKDLPPRLPLAMADEESPFARLRICIAMQ
jgi:hypothetical protein